MNDLQKALSDITDIRRHLANSDLFRGFGPHAVALTGLLALLTAALQCLMVDATASRFLMIWIILAVFCAGLIAIEMWRRTRLHHGTLADAMLANAAEALLPSGAAGAALALVIGMFAPTSNWMLPGLWEIVLSLGIFASLRFMPKMVALVGAWYFLSGVATLILCSGSMELSPWAMGVPFGLGQLLLAAILRLTVGEADEQA